MPHRHVLRVHLSGRWDIMSIIIKEVSDTEKDQRWLCPKCHEHMLVPVGEQSYRCLNCDFERDFSRSGRAASQVGGFIRTLTALLVVVLLMLTFTPARKEEPNIPVPFLAGAG